MKDSINATFEDEMTSQLIVRELGVMSEFWIYGDKYKADFCQRWADERGNDQHETFLTFVSWEERV